MENALSSTAPEFPDSLLRNAIASIPVDGNERAVAGILFDLRARLADRLLENLSRETAPTSDMQLEADRVRNALPPLRIPAGPFRPSLSIVRMLCAVLLGTVLGTAVVQALFSRALPQWLLFEHTDGIPGMPSLLLLGAACGAGLVLWCVHHSRVCPPGLRRRAGWGLVVVAAAVILRDVLQGTPVPLTILGLLGEFLLHGNAAAFCFSLYGTVLCAGLLLWLIQPPVLLDREAFGQRIALAARIWWEGACACVAVHQTPNTPAPDLQRFHQLGSALLSFAGELPPERRAWLEDQLHVLGLEAPRQTALLHWDAELSRIYDPLGYLEPGDPCFEDTPPLREHGRLLRKGRVRKVRT